MNSILNGSRRVFGLTVPIASISFLWLAFHALADDQAGQDSSAPQAPQPPGEHLTPRERDILQLLAEGLTNKEIAVQLHLSEKTIKNRMSEILSKLGVHNRTQAAIWAQKHGIGDNQ